MLIPLAHEDLHGRRWPYVTIAIILLNVAILVLTDARIEREANELFETRIHILVPNARYPDVEMTPAASRMVESYKKYQPDLYKEFARPNRSPIDEWEARHMFEEGQVSLLDINREMADLCAQLEQLENDSVLWQYAFHSHPTPWSWVTAGFLHFGWLHLIFNMWFLWLAGTVLEDAWGRVVYPIFYLAAAAVALLAHAWMFPGSYVPTAGASGAVAGMMGAFLARFPKTKIRMMLIIFLRPYFFNVPAYFILPLWLLVEIFSGSMAADGVAHWAHVGGFAFGVAGALLLRATGVEQAMDKAIEAKISWTANPHFVRAHELFDQNQPSETIAELELMLAEKPPAAEAMDAYELLLKAQDRKQDTPGMRQTLTKLCQLALRSGDSDAAWRYYEQFLNTGSKSFPAAVWLELCRYLEKQQAWERAATEYEHLAKAYPNDRTSITALMAAARIWQSRLNRPDEGERLYHAAQKSPVPHLDVDGMIEHGLKQCAEARGPRARGAGAGGSA